MIRYYFIIGRYGASGNLKELQKRRYNQYQNWVFFIILMLQSILPIIDIQDIKLLLLLSLFAHKEGQPLLTCHNSVFSFPLEQCKVSVNIRFYINK